VYLRSVVSNSLNSQRNGKSTGVLPSRRLAEATSEAVPRGPTPCIWQDRLNFQRSY